jgi:hypothetical protein
VGKDATEGLVQVFEQSNSHCRQVFFFNKKDRKYYLMEPDDAYSNIIEPWGFEDA